MNKEQIEKLGRLLLDKNQPTAIVVHANPDGDAIGSALGLYHFLHQEGFAGVQMVSPNAYPSFLHWMPGNDHVIVADVAPGEAMAVISNAGLLFCLDFNGFGRADQLEQVLSDSKAHKVMIDHHPQPEDGFHLVFSDTRASSTAELVYECIAALKGGDAITLDMAKCLYAGIVTDTGSFSYGCNNPRTYEIVARLIEKGVDGAYLHRLIYSTYSVNRMRLLGYCLSEKLEVIETHRTAYISLTKKDLERFNHREGDTEGVVNYALDIEGINLAALFIEKDGHIKVSFRSAGELDVNRLAREYYHGGGHKNAAGGKSYHNMKKTLAGFHTLVKKGF